jgi:hypothetical protein|tara:strand:+ start:230 stop:388 length:159 start_codon:yes stop_codon:yes gene_type:complete
MGIKKDMKKPNIDNLHKRVNGNKLNLTDRLDAMYQYSNLLRYVAYLEKQTKD